MLSLRTRKVTVVFKVVSIGLVMLLGACTSPAERPASSEVSQSGVASMTFRGTKTEVIRLAIRAIQNKGWKLDQVNESVGLVSFETTMSMGSWTGVSANLLVEEAGRNLYRVSGTAKQNVRGGQVAAFDVGGESQGVLREALAAMRALQPE